MTPNVQYVVFVFRLIMKDGTFMPENVMIQVDHEPNIVELRTIEKRQMREVYGCYSAAVTGWREVRVPDEEAVMDE